MLDDTAHRLFLNALRDVRAIEHEGIALMSRQLDRLERYPDLLLGHRQHLRETEHQIERLDVIFAALSEDPSNLKETIATVVGKVAAFSHQFADDEVLKNHIANIAYENLEIASYVSLLVLARAAGFNAHLVPLQTSLAEERSMADWLDARVADTTQAFLTMAARGQPARA
jgi:ferritin-like metal-binding protein YciE